MPHHLSSRDPVSYEQAIIALATFSDIQKAKELVEAEGYTNVSERALETVQRNQQPKIQEARKEIAPRLEGVLTSDMLDLTRIAVETETLCIERCLREVKASNNLSPKALSTIAREISQVKAQNIDKRLSLEGRPTTITESRNQDEILRSLEAMGVAKQITVEGTAVEE